MNRLEVAVPRYALNSVFYCAICKEVKFLFTSGPLSVAILTEVAAGQQFFLCESFLELLLGRYRKNQ